MPQWNANNWHQLARKSHTRAHRYYDATKVLPYLYSGQKVK